MWLPSAELKDKVGVLDQVATEAVTDWDPGALPDSKAQVEVVVPPQDYSDDFRAVAEQLPQLRVVQTLSAGIDQYRGALPAGVRLYNASGVHVAATAEWVLAAILACERKLLTFHDQGRAGIWAPQPSQGLYGARILIIGAGEIGTAVGERLAPFGARVTFVARHAREGAVGVAHVGDHLPDSDVVVLLVPQTNETVRLVDARFLSSMKDGALLVNAARGPVVDSAALLEQVASGRLRAALDVFDPEPPEPSSPIWSLPGLLLTPHIASNVPGVAYRQAALLRTRLPAFARGEQVLSERDMGYRGDPR